MLSSHRLLRCSPRLCSKANSNRDRMQNHPEKLQLKWLLGVLEATRPGQSFYISKEFKANNSHNSERVFGLLVARLPRCYRGRRNL
mmetsp:Transcript_16077/g.36764  ORF Transcript_16077/g.36764 Transcript_16077/m.36764 type:complete len:86 (+) Transcript_16077:310-567(+)